MKKIALFAFRGDAMCFAHVLLNALDMKEKAVDVKIILEGEATALVKSMEEAGNPLFVKVKAQGLFECICKACSAKMGVLEYNAQCGIPLSDEMSGHPAMSRYIEDGYAIITF